MSITLKITSITALIIIILLILQLVKSNKISIKYSLVWFIPCTILLIYVLVPGFLIWTTKILGFQTASNMILTMLVGLSLLITIALTVIVSGQRKKTTMLIQEVSILKEELKKSKK